MHILTLLLTLSPPDPAPDYATARTSLDAALGTVGSQGISTTQSVAALEDALDLLARHPADIPNDAETLDKLARARVALAWLLLIDGNTDGAAAAMDEALRSARGTVLPVGTFGPKVRALYDERLAALKQQGTAMIEVDCGHVACQVVIDERRSANPSDPLFLGGYRVWIGARDGTGWEYHDVVLDAAGTTKSIDYEAGLAAIAQTETETDTETQPVIADTTTPKKPKRMMPLWAEGLGMAAGVGMIVAAGILLAYDQKCRSGADPGEGEAVCPRVYDNKPQAYSLFGIGGAVTLAFGATLAVDQVRVGRARGQQAVLTWTLRF